MQVEDMQGPDAAIGTQHKEEHCIQVGFGPAAWWAVGAVCSLEEFLMIAQTVSAKKMLAPEKH